MRALLRIREDLEKKIERLSAEVEDLRRALTEIDKVIVRQGFQKPSQEAREEAKTEEERGSVKAKDGTLLGTIQIDDREIAFVPSEGLTFKVSIPPFQSFLVDRVLANMRVSDEARATRGEINPEEVLSYDVSTDGERLMKVVVRNYGGERRLREIRSSLRWTLDKMYEKLSKP